MNSRKNTQQEVAENDKSNASQDLQETISASGIHGKFASFFYRWCGPCGLTTLVLISWVAGWIPIFDSPLARADDYSELANRFQQMDSKLNATYLMSTAERIDSLVTVSCSGNVSAVRKELAQRLLEYRLQAGVEYQLTTECKQ